MKCTKTIMFLLLACLSSTVQAQQVLDLGKNNYDDKKGLVYLQENTFEFNLHTNGAAVGLDFGTIETYYKTKFWHVGIGELKHFRETRQSRSLQGGLGSNFRSFVFGKQNSFFVIRGGYGQKTYFSEKARTKGVAVGYSYEGGPSIGLLKPYYLILRYVSERPGSENYRSERYDGENGLRFLNNESIYGADNFLRGIPEMKFQPGLHGRVALHFDWGSLDEYVKAMELGLMADVYFKEVPIMVESEYTQGINNQMVFLNLFLSFKFGKRQ